MRRRNVYLIYIKTMARMMTQPAARTPNTIPTVAPVDLSVDATAGQ